MDFISILQNTSLINLFLFFILENFIIFILAVAIGQLAIKIFYKKQITEQPKKTTNLDIFYAFTTIVFNSLITLFGLILWRKGIIAFSNNTGIYAILDTFALLIIMDMAMYFLHRIAHYKYIFRLIHKLHHRYIEPTPITLFILSPMEALGFGGLWLFVLCIYSWSWLGMSIYLALNVAFGTIGHLGVEPFPKFWLKIPVLKYISGSTFHFQHHTDKDYNYGFYTTIWDKLFKTLKPDYERAFIKNSTNKR